MSAFSNSSVLDHRGYGILRESLDNHTTKRHEKALSFQPTVLDGYSFTPPPIIKMFKYSPQRIWVPKNYGLEHFGEPSIINERVGDKITAQFTKTLKESQTTVVSDILAKLKTHESGIICLPTGFGKTVIAIYIACVLGVKTLWITHKTNLMEQTRERFVSFTNGTVGTLQQDTIDIDHPFVIGMLQSISMKDYPKEVFDSFGLIIFDEVHRVPSQVFSNSLWKVNSKHIIGLSATLERKDNLDKVLLCCIGPVLKRIEVQARIPIVKCVRAKYHPDNPKEVILNRADKPDLPKLLNVICTDSYRNQLIASEAILAFRQGRTILILSDRRAHCETLKSIIDESVPNECTTGLYLGGMDSVSLKESNDCNVIIGTYTMCAEGYDNSALNTVLLSTSKRDIRQAVGRVLGLRSQGVLEPLIIDICDTFGVFGSQASARKKWYRDEGFNILGPVSKYTQRQSKVLPVCTIED